MWTDQHFSGGGGGAQTASFKMSRVTCSPWRAPTVCIYVALAPRGSAPWDGEAPDSTVHRSSSAILLQGKIYHRIRRTSISRRHPAGPLYLCPLTWSGPIGILPIPIGFIPIWLCLWPGIWPICPAPAPLTGPVAPMELFIIIGPNWFWLPCWGNCGCEYELKTTTERHFD